MTSLTELRRLAEGATIHGWTWIGFDAPEKLAAFESRFPAPEAKDAD